MLRLEVLCFAGTYGLALVSELARFVTRSAARWYVTVGLTALGWLVQTAYLADLGWSQHKLPVTTVFESLLVLSWILALIGLYLMVRSPRPVAVGLFVLPLVLALVLLAGRFASRTAHWDQWHGTTTFWTPVHVIFLLAGAVSTCVAFAAGLMYLVQSNRLKHKRRPRFGFALPSLEQSERLNRGAITLAFPLLTFGLLIGVILDLAAPPSSGMAAGVLLSWTDPKVVSAGLMWLVFAVLLHARFRPAMRGRSVMLLTIVAFAFLVFTWVGFDVLRLPTAHGGGAGAVSAGGRRTL
jgi:ABC-type transport system involved in cytochrome c biogenesis permease subunit